MTPAGQLASGMIRSTARSCVAARLVGRCPVYAEYVEAESPSGATASTRASPFDVEPFADPLA